MRDWHIVSARQGGDEIQVANRLDEPLRKVILVMNNSELIGL